MNSHSPCIVEKEGEMKCPPNLLAVIDSRLSDAEFLVNIFASSELEKYELDGGIICKVMTANFLDSDMTFYKLLLLETLSQLLQRKKEVSMSFLKTLPKHTNMEQKSVLEILHSHRGNVGMMRMISCAYSLCPEILAKDLQLHRFDLRPRHQLLPEILFEGRQVNYETATLFSLACQVEKKPNGDVINGLANFLAKQANNGQVAGFISALPDNEYKRALLMLYIERKGDLPDDSPIYNLLIALEGNIEKSKHD